MAGRSTPQVPRRACPRAAESGYPRPPGARHKSHEPGLGGPSIARPRTVRDAAHDLLLLTCLPTSLLTDLREARWPTWRRASRTFLRVRSTAAGCLLFLKKLLPGWVRGRWRGWVAGAGRACGVCDGCAGVASGHRLSGRALLGPRPSPQGRWRAVGLVGRHRHGSSHQRRVPISLGNSGSTRSSERKTSCLSRVRVGVGGSPPPEDLPVSWCNGSKRVCD